MDTFLHTQPSPQQPSNSTTTCPHCHIHLDSPKSLSIHIIRMHTATGVSPIMQGFPCRYCEKVYSTEANLLAHQSTQHGGVLGATDQQFAGGQSCQSNLYNLRPPLTSTGDITIHPNTTSVTYPTIPSYTSSSQSIYTQGSGVEGMSAPVMHMDGLNQSSLQYKDIAAPQEGVQQPLTETRGLFPHSQFNTYPAVDISNNGVAQKPLHFQSNPPVTTTTGSNLIFSNLDLGLSYTNTDATEINTRNSTRPLITGPCTHSTIPYTHTVSNSSQVSSEASFTYPSIQDISANVLPSHTRLPHSQVNTDVTFSSNHSEISPSHASSNLTLRNVTETPLHTGQSNARFTYHGENLNQSESVTQTQRLDNITTESYPGPPRSSEMTFAYQADMSCTRDLSMTIQPSRESTQASMGTHSNTTTTLSQVTFSYQTENLTVAEFPAADVPPNHHISCNNSVTVTSSSPRFLYQSDNSKNPAITSHVPNLKTNQDPESLASQSSSQMSASGLTFQRGISSPPTLPAMLARSTSAEEKNLEISQDMPKSDSMDDCGQGVAVTDVTNTINANVSVIISPVSHPQNEPHVFNRSPELQNDEHDRITRSCDQTKNTSLCNENNPKNDLNSTVESSLMFAEVQQQLDNPATAKINTQQDVLGNSKRGGVVRATKGGIVEDLEQSMKQHWASVEKQITPTRTANNVTAERKGSERADETSTNADSICHEESARELDTDSKKTKIMSQNEKICDKLEDKEKDATGVADDDYIVNSVDHGIKQKNVDVPHEDEGVSDGEDPSVAYGTKQTMAGVSTQDDDGVPYNEEPSLGHNTKQINSEIVPSQNNSVSDNKTTCLKHNNMQKNNADNDDARQSLDEDASNKEVASVNEEEDVKSELTCSICDQEFKTPRGLKRHNTVKHKKLLTNGDGPILKKHTCVICQRNFQTLAKLNKHRISHKGTEGRSGHRKLRSDMVTQLQQETSSESMLSGAVKQLVCAQCKKTFKNLRALNMHKISHRRSGRVRAKTTKPVQARKDGEKDKSDSLSCKECGKTFKTKRGLTCHSHDTHKTIKEGPTKELTKQDEQTQEELSEHMKSDHKVERPKRSAGKSRERCHICSTCGKAFLERSHLKEHEKRHGEADIPCPKCDKKFKFITDLRKHQRSHSDNKPFICPTCGNTFKAASHLAEHELRHGEAKFACQYCGKRYHVEREMKKHEKIHTDKIYPCPHCEDEFKERTALQEHVKEHEQKGTLVVKQFMCTHCKLYFSSEKGLLHHLNNKHRQLIKAEDRWQCICDYCNRVCQTEEALKLHKKLHKGDRMFPCSKCDKFFKSRQHLKEHEKRHGEANLSCKICNWKFVLAVDLRKHEKRHAMNKSLPCKHCEKKFSTNGALNAHIKRHTQSASSFVCTHCKLGFRSNLGLKYHQNNKHFDKLPASARWTHFCDHCNMVFPTASSMLRHKNMQGKYSCQICNLTFRTEKAYKLHQQIHLGLRNHCCPVCKKGFKKAHHLAEHMKRHSEGKHPCKMCGKKYVFLTDLRKHMKLSHLSSKLLPCTQCENKFPSERMLRQHVMLHHQAPVEKQHVCYDCNLQFSGAKGLLSHMNNKHRDKLNEKDRWKFQCQQCQRMFRSTKALEVHAQVHSDIRPHECAQCGKRFKEARHMIEHTKRHGEGQHPCPKCDKKYVFERDLVKHLKTHNEIKEFVCKECGKGFAKSSDLNAHLMRHEQAKKDPSLTKVKPLQCPHCSLTFVHKKGMDTHMNNKHRDELEEDERWPYWCDRCKKAFRTKTAMKKHEPEHLGRRDFICEVCKKSFKEARHLTEHQKRHNKPTLKCSQCSKKYVFERDLQKHVKTHTEERPFKCPKCIRQYGLKSALDTHMKLHEQTQAKYVCQFCTLGFTSNICLLNHLNNNHRDDISAEDRWEHICKYCSKSYPTEEGLTKHERIHRNLKVHRCNICDKHFKLAHHLSQHEKRHQEGELPCQYCQKKYVFASDLRKHVRIHTGEKPFCCEYCGKRFRVSGGLRKHLRLHEQISKVPIPKPYKCKSCKKSFRLKEKLTNHMKVHEEKQFACTTCKKKFCFEKTLQRHLLTHSATKPYKCYICPRQFVEEGTLSRHIKKHENGSLKPKAVKTYQGKQYQCNHCAASFATDYKKNYHMNKKHRDVIDPALKWAHVCSHCSRPFATGRALQKHEAIHSNQQIFQCLLCPKHFKTMQELNKHSNWHVQQQQQLSDQQVQQQQATQQIQQHSVHQQQLSAVQQHIFMCKFCSKGFVNPGDLRQHESSHTAADNIVTVPFQSVPLQGVPLQGIPMQSIPLQGIPKQGVPVQGIQGVPIHGVPLQGVPIQGVPVQGVPLQGVPLQGVPLQGVPLQGVPLQGDVTYNQDGFIQVALCGGDTTGFDGGQQVQPVQGRTDGHFELLAELISATNNILTLNN